MSVFRVTVRTSRDQSRGAACPAIGILFIVFSAMKSQIYRLVQCKIEEMRHPKGAEHASIYVPLVFGIIHATKMLNF
jgi:hypothetical protein